MTDETEIDDIDTSADIEDVLSDRPPLRRKPSEAELQKLLTFLTRDPILAHGMKAIGRRSDSLIWQWLKASREGDERFLVRWPNPAGSPVFLHDAILTARSAQCAAFEAVLRRDAALGTPRVLRNMQTGEPLWEHDALVMAKYSDKAAADAAGVFDFPYAHTQDGRRIEVVVFDQMPAAARVHVARSVLGDAYNPSDRRTVDQRHSGGVLVLRATRQGADAKVLPPYARERMTSGASSAPVDDGRTPLQRDLLKRLADLRANGPRNPRPSGRVDTGGGSSAGEMQDDIARQPPAGAVKVK